MSIKNFTPLHLIFLSLPVFFIRFELFTFPTNLLDLILALSLLWFLWTQKPHLKTLFKPDLINLSAFAIFLGGTLALTQVLDLPSALGIWKSWLLLPLLVFFMLRHSISKSPHPQTLITSLFFTASIPISLLSLWGLFEIATSSFETFDGRLESIFQNANELALLLTPILAWHLLSLFKKSDLTLHLIFIIILLPTLIFTQSFGAILALFLSLLFSFFFLPLPHQTKIWSSVSLLFIAILTFFAISTTPKFDQMLDFQNRSSSTVRLELWQVALHLSESHFLLGIGPGQFQPFYQASVNSVLGRDPFELNHPQPHNLFSAFHLQTGLLGLVGFLTSIILGFRAAFRAKISRRTVAVFAAFLVIFFHGFVDTPFWRADLALIFWLIMASLLASNLRK